MLPSFFQQDITVIRPGTTTSRGSTVYDWTKTTTHSITGCSVQPASTTLDINGRVLGISEGLTAFIPYDSDVQEGDRIVYDGDTYTIEGVPQPSISPTGSISSIKLHLKRWEG